MDTPTTSSSHAALSAKRNRPTLSCVHCRQAKAKCDRQNPCALCIKKGRAEQCTYPLPVSRKKAAVSLQKRLRNLESMVKDVMASNAMDLEQPITQRTSSGDSYSNSNTVFATTTTSSLTSQLHGGSNDFTPASKVVLDGNESKYIGNTHWKSILENVGRTSAMTLILIHFRLKKREHCSRMLKETLRRKYLRRSQTIYPSPHWQSMSPRTPHALTLSLVCLLDTW